MTTFGQFEMFGFVGRDPTKPIVALTVGDLDAAEWSLVRVQSKCETSEVFGSVQCDCADQLHYSMQLIQSEGRGAIIYLDQEGRGNGLLAKLQIYQLMQDEQLTSEEACKWLYLPVDAREYADAASVVVALGIPRARLLTNSPDKVRALSETGITIRRERIPVAATNFNRTYLAEKQFWHGHDLGLPQSWESLLPDLHRSKLPGRLPHS